MGKGKNIPAIVRESGLLAPGDQILAGVSGGADSVCLFLVLKELAQEIGFTLGVVHVEHGLRGSESKADAAFVQKLCEKNGIPFCLKEVDVRAEKTTHISEEETARNLRREAFLEAADTMYPDKDVKVALAHNADDQAETVLMHLIRGTGLKGLCGMQAEAPLAGWMPVSFDKDTSQMQCVEQSLEKKGESDSAGRSVRQLRIIRPLLSITRAEIEVWLAACGQEFRTDATNFEDSYTRNRIRHNILPMLIAINPQAVTHIGQTARTLQEIEDEIEKNAIFAANEAIINLKLNRVLVAAYPPEVQNRIIKAWIYKRNQTVRNVSSTHIRAVSALFSAPNGTKLDIPGAYRVRVEGDYLVWEEKSGRNAPNDKKG
ncbi:MAG: tRNA lysidine(34) synthetase TilS [Lachnospiraceae bacterium]|nr:tRNA lysidine(34) synthetase TilS [Lachnospiraceae bacterium]